MLAIVVSQPVAAVLLTIHRGWRKSLWFIGGSLNRILWALIPLSLVSPHELRFPILSSIVFIAQFMGGVAGVAAMDCIGANVSGGLATRVFSRVNKLSYVSYCFIPISGYFGFPTRF